MRHAVLKSLGAAAAALMCGCAGPRRTAPIPAPPPAFLASRPRASSCPLVIGVLIDGWHGGLILPVRELGPLGPLLPRYPDERYSSFGWGNRRFYMSPHPTLADAVFALFSSPSAVLVHSAPTLHAWTSSGATVRWLCADQDEVWRMDAYLRRALGSPGGRPTSLGKGLQADSAFYASDERYDALHTCNTWTADALESAGYPIHDNGVIFSGQLERRIGRLPTCPDARRP